MRIVPGRQGSYGPAAVSGSGGGSSLLAGACSTVRGAMGPQRDAGSLSLSESPAAAVEVGCRREGMAEEVGGEDGTGARSEDGKAGRERGHAGVMELRSGTGARGGVDMQRRLVAAFENGEPGVEARAAAGVDTAVDDAGEEDAGGGTGVVEGFAPGAVSGGAVGGGDRCEAASCGEHREGGPDMAQVGVVVGRRDAGGGREGGVHDDDGRPEPGQPVGNGLGVDGADREAGEELAQKRGAGGADLVEVQLGRGAVTQVQLCHDGEHSGAGGGLQDDIAGLDGGGPNGRPCEREREWRTAAGGPGPRSGANARARGRQALPAWRASWRVPRRRRAAAAPGRSAAGRG